MCSETDIFTVNIYIYVYILKQMIFSKWIFWNRWFTVNIYSETDDLTVNIYSETDDFTVNEYSETDNFTVNI